MLIEGTYVAEGGEQWMTIANFDTYTETNELLVNGGIYEGSYYYVDDVRVMPEPGPEILGETTMCFGDSITLTGINTDEWSWSTVFDPDLVFSTDTSITVSPTQSTLYYLDDGDVLTTHLITVNPLPNIDLGEDQILCDGTDFLVDPNLEEGDFMWQDESTESTYLVTDSGQYWLEYSNGICSNADSIEVTFNPQVNFSLGVDTLICSGDIIELSAPLEYVDYNLDWNSGQETISISVSEEGIYSLEIDDGVCFGSDEVEVFTISCEILFELPNIFTPNATHGNDIFTPIVIENIIEVESDIYDRWGNLIFHSQELNIGWDGKNLEGKDVAEGTYYYVVNYLTITGDQLTKSGYIMVLR